MEDKNDGLCTFDVGFCDKSMRRVTGTALRSVLRGYKGFTVCKMSIDASRYKVSYNLSLPRWIAVDEKVNIGAALLREAVRRFEDTRCLCCNNDGTEPHFNVAEDYRLGVYAYDREAWSRGEYRFSVTFYFTANDANEDVLEPFVWRDCSKTDN